DAADHRRGREAKLDLRPRGERVFYAPTPCGGVALVVRVSRRAVAALGGRPAVAGGCVLAAPVVTRQLLLRAGHPPVPAGFPGLHRLRVPVYGQMGSCLV